MAHLTIYALFADFERELLATAKESKMAPSPDATAAVGDDAAGRVEWLGGSDENMADDADAAVIATKSSASAAGAKGSRSALNAAASAGVQNPTAAKSKSRKDIWALVKEAKERDRKAGADAEAPSESTLFILGSKNSGKSSLIMRFLDRDETPTPSVALEYTFGRRTRNVNSIKDVVHIWELAGGTFLSDLIEIPISEFNIHMSSFAVVFDLSKPSISLDTLEILLEKLHAYTNKVLEGLEQRGSKRPKGLRSYASRKYGIDHPDKDAVKLMPVPITIIGSKYDEIKNMESERRKLLCKMLRYIAHINGASLMFVSIKDENLVSRSRQLLSHYAFRGSSVKSMSVDHNKPVVVMAGQDTLSQIGLPPSEMAKQAVGRQTVVPYERWRADFDSYFPRQEVEKALERVDLSKFPESAIDAMRAQKDEELEKLKRSNERKSKDKDAVSGISGLSAIGNSGKDKKKGKSYSRAK